MQPMSPAMASVSDIERIRLWAEENYRPVEEVTLYVSNLAPNYTKSALRKWMDSTGCMNGCDYLHVPRNFQTRACLGFAFVNFVDTPSAQRFARSPTPKRS